MRGPWQHIGRTCLGKPNILHEEALVREARIVSQSVSPSTHRWISRMSAWCPREEGPHPIFFSQNLQVSDKEIVRGYNAEARNSRSGSTLVKLLMNWNLHHTSRPDHLINAVEPTLAPPRFCLLLNQPKPSRNIETKPIQNHFHYFDFVPIRPSQTNRNTSGAIPTSTRVLAIATQACFMEQQQY